jgi:antitoxin YefM
MAGRHVSSKKRITGITCTVSTTRDVGMWILLVGYNFKAPQRQGSGKGAISFSRFCRNPSKVIESVVDNEEPVTITRADGRNVVIVPLDEFESCKETAHLLSSAKNAKRLREAKDEINAEIAKRCR